MKRNTIVLGGVLLLLAILGWAGWANWEYRQQQAEKRLASAAQGELVPSADGESMVYRSPLQGKAAPAFALEDLTGKKVSLANYKGKAVLVNFWATWCGPCKIETPWLIELRNKYAAQGFEVLGVDTEGDDLKAGDKAGWTKARTEAKKFTDDMKIDYPVLLNGDSVSEPYGGLDALPTSFYIDRNGTVIAAQEGLTSEAEIESNIKKALGGGAS